MHVCLHAQRAVLLYCYPGWLFIIVYSLTVSIGIAIGIGVADSYQRDSIAALATQVRRGAGLWHHQLSTSYMGLAIMSPLLSGCKAYVIQPQECQGNQHTNRGILRKWPSTWYTSGAACTTSQLFAMLCVITREISEEVINKYLFHHFKLPSLTQPPQNTCAPVDCVH